MRQIKDAIAPLLEVINSLHGEEKIEAINSARVALSAHSPFASEPVDCVLWIRADQIVANDYNPNTVAPPEMELLRHSIESDGYTQPIVAWKVSETEHEVVDGFHRHRVGRECENVKKRIHGHLPITIINDSRLDRGDRISATIRHNRARGKHGVDAMSEIVVELKRRNWSDARIGKELGMDQDEVLRLAQISGLSEMFADREFSEAWEHIGENDIIQENEDEGEVSLEWGRGIKGREIEPGWDHRTEKSSILYGENGHHLGAIQKDRYSEEWFWYAYTQPMRQGKAPDKQKSMAMVEESHNE